MDGQSITKLTKTYNVKFGGEGSTNSLITDDALEQFVFLNKAWWCSYAKKIYLLKFAQSIY